MTSPRLRAQANTHKYLHAKWNEYFGRERGIAYWGAATVAASATRFLHDLPEYRVLEISFM